MRQSILLEAEELINGDRAAAYGPASRSFERISKLASILTEKDITPIDVCKIMIALKLSRETNKPGRDNRVDAAAYIELLDQLQ